MIADIMREVANDATEKDATVQKAVKICLARIEEEAKQGKRKTTFCISWKAFKDDDEYKKRYNDVKDMVARELRKEGFRIARGSEIGERYGNWNVDFIVW